MLFRSDVAAARDEVGAVTALALHPGRIRRSHELVLRTTTEPARVVRSLRPSAASQARQGLEALAGVLTTSGAVAPSTAVSALDSGPVGDDADFMDGGSTGLTRRLLGRPSVFMGIVLTVLAVIGTRGLWLGDGVLQGGALLPAPQGASDLWSTFTQAWHDVGPGSSTPSSPYLVVVAALALRGCDVDHLPGDLELHRHVGEHELQALEVGDGLTELLAVLGISQRPVQRFLRAWSTVSAKRNPAVMLDQASLSWFAELNRSLSDKLDDAQFRARLRESTERLRLLAREMLGRMRPVYPPGLVHIYHGVTWGPLVREIVLAATGRNIREILATEILDPLGFRWTNYGVAEADLPLVALSHPTGKPLPAPIARAFKLAVGGTLHQIIPFTNTPAFLTSVVPSSSTVSNADELSRFAEILCRGGELDGLRIMRPETLAAATAPARRLRPDIATGLMPMRWGTGYMLGSKRFGPFGRNAPDAFGHTGLTNIAVWADPARNLAAAVVSSGKPGGHPEANRYPALLDAIAREIPQSG